MTTHVEAAVERLSRQLPLAARQRELPPELASLHRAILSSLFERGRPLTREECAPLLAATSVDEALARLGAADLIVLAANGRDVAGAYPMTTEPTPHQLILPGRSVHAMCALDALSVTPMFGGAVEIRSACRVSGEPVVILEQDATILDAAPAVLVGVAWQKPCGGHAAHSLCREMVFLKDAAAAQSWHGGDLANHSVFTLAEAVEFGSRFFTPLVG
jgi:hypothetical protein